MKDKLLLGLGVFFLNGTVMAYDPLTVLTMNAPKNCVDKEIVNSPMGLPELIEIGVCNNSMLNRGYMEAKSKEASFGKSKSEYLPTVTLSGDAAQTYSKIEDVDSNTNNQYLANAALSWLVYDFGGRSARVKRAENYMQSAGFAYNALLKDTFLKINHAYFELLSAKEVLKSAKTSEKSFKKAYEESSKRYDLGLVSLSDKLLAKTSYEESRLTVVQAENKLKEAQGALASLLNISPTFEFNLLKPKNDKDLTVLELKEDSVEKMIETALSLRPEIQKSQKDIEAAIENTKAQKADGMPKLSFVAKGQFSDDWKEHDSYNRGSSVGLNLSVPLFTGFSNTYAIKQAEFEEEQAKFSKQETVETVKNEVWTAYHNYKTAVSSYDITKKALESAVENERVAFASYQVGKGDILNLLTAGSQLATSRREVIVAYYSVLKSKAALYRAIGRF